MPNNPTCPICKTALKVDQVDLGDREHIDCPQCGKFQLSRSLLSNIKDYVVDAKKRALVSHAIRKMQNQTEVPYLNTYSIKPILSNELPSLSEQINNLILWLGDNYDPGREFSGRLEMLQAVMGSKSPDGAIFVIRDLKGRLITGTDAGNVQRMQLTMPGWNYYEQLKRGAVMSRKAFMAMKFGNPDLDHVFVNHFKPAVSATGFELYRLDEQPRAGLIDDRLRVEIRTSRFLIADLTDENQGAYWEAGYAEGLGKPVIYTCEKSKFDHQKTHFDTNHHLTIVWDKQNLEESAAQLKATIRATLPDEARLAD